MTDDLLLRRKWTFRAHGRRLVVVKKSVESAERFIDDEGRITVAMDELERVRLGG